MSKRIVYSRPDGGVAVVHIAPQSRLFFDRPGYPPVPEPEAYWLQRVAAQVVPANAQDVHVVETTDIPTDRTFRNAWTHQAGVIGVHMDRAREVHRERLRTARQPMLAQLDVEYQRAHERDDKTHMQTVATAKQLLRDVTTHPDIDAAQTPDELRAVWPFESSTPAPTPFKVASLPPVEKPASGGHSTGWIGTLVGKIEEEELPPLPTPLAMEQPAPEAPYHLPAPEPASVPQDDTTRRRAAKARVRGVAATYAFDQETERLRYEEALMAHNGNITAIETFTEEARGLGISVRALAERIVNAHTVHARRMMRVKKIQDDAIAALNAASGEEIAAIEQKAVDEMTGNG